MKLLIDNLDGRGALDYTAFVDSSKNPSLVRKLNSAGEFKFGLVAGNIVPVIGARVTLTLSNGNNLFTGYIAQTPTYQYLGWADPGAVYLYEVVALSDVMLMDLKAPPPPPPFVDRNAGDAFRQLTAEALPAWFDVTSVQAGTRSPISALTQRNNGLCRQRRSHSRRAALTGTTTASCFLRRSGQTRTGSRRMEFLSRRVILSCRV